MTGTDMAAIADQGQARVGLDRASEGLDRAGAGLHRAGTGADGDWAEPAGDGARTGGGWPTGDLGMATAEYAVATLAAVGFAGLLFAVLRSGEVQELLLELVRRALSSV